MTKIDSGISRRLTIAIVLTAVTMVAEVIGGIWTNSLALLSDAAHVFLDLFALILSLVAIRLAALPPSDRHTFGYHRSEVFASFINGVTVCTMAIGILYEAWGRFLHPEPVQSLPMLLIAIVGLIMNLLSAGALHDHSHDDLNVKSAFLHVVGDALASIGVIAGGVIIHFTGWYLLDSLVSAAIALLILAGAGRVLRESVHILMEGVPRGLDLNEVADTIRSVEGVRDIHHLNIWTVCSHILALSVHVDCDEEREISRASILHRIEHLLADRFHITHTTIQMECSVCVGGGVIKEMTHRERGSCSHHH